MGVEALERQCFETRQTPVKSFDSNAIGSRWCGAIDSLHLQHSQRQHRTKAHCLDTKEWFV